MRFFQRIFGRKSTQSPYIDTSGLYFYVECGRCRRALRLRADKRYDVEAGDGGYTWHKTIVCPRCFNSMPTTVQLDAHYQITAQALEKGRYLTAEEFTAAEAARTEKEQDSAESPQA